MKLSTNMIKIALLAMAPLLVVSCRSTPKNPNQSTQVNPDNVAEWWNRPGILGNYAAIGTAKMVVNEAAVRNRAETDGRNKLAASIKSTIQSISENWSQEAGDLMDEATLSSMLNDETFIRQMVDTALVGSVVTRYQVSEGYMYVLMTLENPDAFHAHLVSTVSLPSKTASQVPVPKTGAAKRVVRKKTRTTIGRKNR